MELLGLPIEHIGNVGLAKRENNNRIERLHGTIKGWVKSKRGAKEKTREFIEAYRAYYNHIRPNIAIGDEAPAKTEKKLVAIVTSTSKE